MSFYGENLKLNIFGQSHSPYIGMSLDGVPAGFKIDFEQLQGFLNRRAPGRSKLSTARKEDDIPQFISGLRDGISCGNTITAIIKNSDARPEDYEQYKNLPRPGHADYTAAVKYGGFQDYSGGGAFSGRLTAPLCIAGGICLQLLKLEGIKVISRIYSIASLCDESLLKDDLSHKAFPVVDDKLGEQMLALIDAARKEGDSVGGIIECAVLNLPVGLGGPLFQGMESRIAAAAFAIPGVKGIDFGAGIHSSKMKGSENNDCYCLNEGKIQTETNNCGGILGGITNGMPLKFRLYIKPTPSVAKPQKTVDLENLQEKEVSVSGRHDPCIVPRALPVAEAIAAIAVYDSLLERRKEMRSPWI